MRSISFACHSMFCLLSLGLLAACDKVVDGSQAAAGITQHAVTDAADAWKDAFTYHPKQGPQAPQTRYCYQMYGDIVCYDSLQPGLTAKLVGYQDGSHVSGIQPGGGSLGASGGDPVAYHNAPASSIDQTTVIATKTAFDDKAVSTPTHGTIQTMDLAPPR